MNGMKRDSGIGTVSSAIRFLTLATALTLGLSLNLKADDDDIRVDTVSSTTSTGAVTFSWQHTVNPGPYRYLIVNISLRGSQTSSPPVQVSSVTFGDTPLERIQAAYQSSSVQVEQFELVAPPVSTATIKVTLTSAASAVAGAISFFNVNQTNPRYSNGGFQGTGTLARKDSEGYVRTVAVDVVAVLGTSTVTPLSPQTEHWNTSTGSTSDDVKGGSSTKPGILGDYENWEYISCRWTVNPSSDYAIAVSVLQPVKTPTLARVRHISAHEQDSGVLVRWDTDYEFDNLGFNLYREDKNGRVRITPSLVAGSALFVGSGREMGAGRSYQWFDPNGGRMSRYWLEDVDLSGQKTLHGPIAVTESESPRVLASRRNSVLLADANTSVPGDRAGSTRQIHPVQLASKSGDLVTQWSLADNPRALRMAVKQDGWYRITRAQLAAAGLHVSDNLRLYCEGKRVPLRINSVQPSRRARSRGAGEESVEFYGRGIDTPSTDARIYWLVADSHQPAKELPLIEPPGAAAGPIHFWTTVERRDRTVYVANVLDDSRDNFFGDLVTSTPCEQVLTLTHPEPNSSLAAELEVSLQGITDFAHRVSVSLNGYRLGVVEFEGMERKSQAFSFDQGLLRAGDNRVKLVSEGGETDVSAVDYTRLTYSRKFVAENDELLCSVPAQKKITVHGFSSPNVRVVDVTDPENCVELLGEVVKTPDGFGVKVGSRPGQGERVLFAFADSAVKVPSKISTNARSRWNDASNSADFIIITHRVFTSAAERLRLLREGEGYQTVVVDVEDVYDEFSYGMKDPAAIRSFLEHAVSTWAKAPRFVVLFGDATFDPRNYLGSGDFDFVPTRLLATNLLTTSSDDWFVDFQNRAMPEIAIGRLPVRSVEEANRVVDKLAAYQESFGDWRHRAVFVSDQEDIEAFSFEEASASLQGQLPPSVTGLDLKLGLLPQSSQRAALAEAFNTGHLLVNYIGHGSTGFWTKKGVFDVNDAAALTNGDRLPIVVALNCLNGMFDDIYSESLAEALLKSAGGGAVAVLASSALTDPSGQSALAQNFYSQLFEGKTLGEALAAAKVGITDQDVRQTFFLFGDPTLRLR